MVYMTIKKFLHSCVVMEEQGKRLLFDPGLFVFIENTLQPEDIGGVDVVVITHLHPDHYYPEALQKLFSVKPFTVVASEEIVRALAADAPEIPTQSIAPGEEKNVAGFTIKAFDVPHERIPIACPHNMGYMVNHLVYHPGDSYVVPDGLGQVHTLLLPNGGPWATTQQTVDFARAVQPFQVIPIHDGMHKAFWLERLNASMAGWMKDAGIAYVGLDGTEISIDTI